MRYRYKVHLRYIYIIYDPWRIFRSDSTIWWKISGLCNTNNYSVLVRHIVRPAILLTTVSVRWINCSTSSPCPKVANKLSGVCHCGGVSAVAAATRRLYWNLNASTRYLKTHDIRYTYTPSLPLAPPVSNRPFFFCLVSVSVRIVFIIFLISVITFRLDIQSHYRH